MVAGAVELRVRDLPAAVASHGTALFLPRGSAGPGEWPAGPYIQLEAGMGGLLPRERRWSGQSPETVEWEARALRNRWLGHPSSLW